MKTNYRVTVRRKGFKTLCKTFNKRTDAQKWSRGIEHNLDRGISTDAYWKLYQYLVLINCLIFFYLPHPIYPPLYGKGGDYDYLKETFGLASNYIASKIRKYYREL